MLLLWACRSSEIFSRHGRPQVRALRQVMEQESLCSSGGAAVARAARASKVRGSGFGQPQWGKWQECQSPTWTGYSRHVAGRSIRSASKPASCIGMPRRGPRSSFRGTSGQLRARQTRRVVGQVAEPREEQPPRFRLCREWWEAQDTAARRLGHRRATCPPWMVLPPMADSTPWPHPQTEEEHRTAQRAACSLRQAEGR